LENSLKHPNKKMNLLIDKKEIKIHSINRVNNKEIQVNIEYYPTIKKDNILIFNMNDGEEVLGIIKDYEDSELHRLLYVEINPNQRDNFSILEISSILLWGAV